MDKKQVLKAYLDGDLLTKEKDELINSKRHVGQLETYSDDTVVTKTTLYRFKLVRPIFPTAEFEGYDSVECPDIIDQLTSALAHLQLQSGTDVGKVLRERLKSMAPDVPADAPDVELETEAPKKK